MDEQPIVEDGMAELTYEQPGSKDLYPLVRTDFFDILRAKFFPPERTKKILGRFKGITANILGTLLGIMMRKKLLCRWWFTLKVVCRDAMDVETCVRKTRLNI